MAFSTLPWSVFGLRVSGDLAGYTCYTDKYGRKIFYPRAPPDKPPTQAQLQRRDLFRQAVLAWKSLSTDDKANLEAAVARTSLCLTGQNLYVSCSMRQDPSAYDAISRQSNLALPPLYEFNP